MWSSFLVRDSTDAIYLTSDTPLLTHSLYCIHAEAYHGSFISPVILTQLSREHFYCVIGCGFRHFHLATNFCSTQTPGILLMGKRGLEKALLAPLCPYLKRLTSLLGWNCVTSLDFVNTNSLCHMFYPFFFFPLITTDGVRKGCRKQKLIIHVVFFR